MPEAKGKPIKQFKPYKNDKSVIDSWKSLSPRSRIIIGSCVFVFSSIGLYVSDKLEDTYRPSNQLNQHQPSQQPKYS